MPSSTRGIKRRASSRSFIAIKRIGNALFCCELADELFDEGGGGTPNIPRPWSDFNDDATAISFPRAGNNSSLILKPAFFSNAANSSSDSPFSAAGICFVALFAAISACFFIPSNVWRKSIEVLTKTSVSSGRTDGAPTARAGPDICSGDLAGLRLWFRFLFQRQVEEKKDCLSRKAIARDAKVLIFGERLAASRMQLLEFERHIADAHQSAGMCDHKRQMLGRL